MAATDPDLVLTAVDRGVATLTLDSPANRNALSSGLVGQLAAGLADAAADPEVRAIVLAHTSTTFCAGADLAEAAREGGPAAGTARLVALLRQVLELPKPVVARLDGHARAGGLGVLGACDAVVAGPGATFAFTEARLGLAPAIISLTVLPRITDRSASRLFLTGEMFSPEEAVRIGLVTEAVDDPAVGVERLVDAFRLCSPQGLAEAKALTTASVLAAFDARADQLTELSARLFSSEEAQEGIASFRERRPARWQVP